MRKKKNYRVSRTRVFIRKFISTVIVCALFAAAVTVGAVIYIRGEVLSISGQASDILQDAYNNNMGEEFVRAAVTNLSSHDTFTDNFLAIYDENGSYYICPEDTVAFYFKKDENTNIHCCKPDSLAESTVEEIKAKYVSNTDKPGDPEYYFISDRFCLTGDDTFIPLETSVYTNSVCTDEYRTDTVIYDGSIPEDAEIYTADEAQMSRLRFCFVQTDAEKFDLDYVRRLVKNNGNINTTITGFDYVTTVSPIIIDGEKYVVGETAVLNTSAVVKTVLLFIIPIAIIITLLRTSKEYAVLSAHYEIEDRRRDITNKLAHDLKSPLMVISGYAENLENGVNPEKNTHYASAILENVKYMDSIIANVLELSKLENADTPIESTEFDAAEMLRGTVAIYEAELEKNGLKLTVNGSAVFTADKALMKDILTNLTENAVKYTDRSGSITAECRNGYIRITNDCSAADKLNADELVKPFVKGDNSRSGRNGTGLGLSIAAEAARRLGLSLDITARDGKFSVTVSER